MGNRIRIRHGKPRTCSQEMKEFDVNNPASAPERA
jgi:hypothetical protein